MEKKTKNVVIVGIVLLLLVGTIALASAESQLTVSSNSTSFNIINWFKNLVGIQTFSIVGDTRQCARYPGQTVNIAFGGTIPSGSTYYANSLTDVFDKNYNALGEWANSPALSCGSSQGCIAEYYSCPHAECTSNSQCSSWYGSGSQCLTQTANDPNIKYYDANYNLLSSFNYCSTPSQQQITCYYYQSGSSCSTRTYYGDTSCPTSYNGMTLYSSNSACQATIPSCTTGQTKCDSPGQTYYTCSNGNWQSQGLVNGQCGYTPTTTTTSNSTTNPPVTAGLVGDIRLNGKVQVSDSYLTGRYLSTFSIPLKNFGTATETINVESGFYSASYATSVAKLYSIIPLFSTVTTPNCNPAENFVGTQKVTLGPGEEQTIKIQVNPYSSLITYSVGSHDLAIDPPVWFTGLYTKCLGGYTNDANSTGKGIMFDYGNYPVVCPIVTADIYCGTDKVGTCGGGLVQNSQFTITKQCEITSTVDIVNNGKNPTAQINQTTLIAAKKIALDTDTISTSTSADLLASSCLSSSECITDLNHTASCVTISNLESQGVLTKADATNFFTNAGHIAQGATFGAAAGLIGCVAVGATVTAASGGVLAPLLVGCGVAGGLLGGSLTSIAITATSSDPLLKELNAKNANVVGICVKQSPSSTNLAKYFGWAAFFKITGDKGVDGLIIVMGFLLLLFLFFGGRK